MPSLQRLARRARQRHPGRDYTNTFTVNPLPSNAVVVSLLSFARGYGQVVNVPASMTSSIPVTLSNGQNATSVTFTLRYDPTLLTPTGFTTPIAGAVATFNVPTPGSAILTINAAAGQTFSTTSGALTLGYITANVPSTAPYASKELLDITNLTVFDNSPNTPLPLPAVADDAIRVVAFFGDTNGDMNYTTQDVTLELRSIALVNSGFAAYRLADPLLIGDINSNEVIQSNDTTSIQRVIALQSVPNIPPLPTGITPPPVGPDPDLYIANAQGSPGSTVNVPVMLKVTEPAGISLSSFQIFI
jgi:hypothetical protein